MKITFENTNQLNKVKKNIEGFLSDVSDKIVISYSGGGL